MDRLLHLASLASMVGIGFSVWGAWEPDVPPPDRRQVGDRVRRLIAIGNQRQPQQLRWRYDDSTMSFWKQFGVVNLTGLLPKELPPGPGRRDVPQNGARTLDLSEHILLVCVSYGGDGTRAVVEYLADLGAASTEPVAPHHVGLGDPLLPPLQRFHLIEVAMDCRSVTFEDRQAPKVAGAWPTQVVYRGVHVLDPEAEVVTGRPRIGPQLPLPVPARSQAAEPWVDVGRTREVEPGVFILGGSDRDYLEQHGGDFFQRSVGLQDYRSGTGADQVRGVTVTRLGRRVRRVGLEVGDVLISLNGRPVKDRLSLMRAGRRLWKKGVREFRLRFLRRGLEQETVYKVPAKR